MDVEGIKKGDYRTRSFYDYFVSLYEYVPRKIRDRYLNVGHSFREAMDTPKYLLKKMAIRYLPEKAVFRKKVGFQVPLNGWVVRLNGGAKEILKDAYWIKADA